MHFASNLKYLRNKRTLTQKDLAEVFNLTRGQLASYEDGRAQPSLEALIRFSDYFKIPIDTLVKHDVAQLKDGAYIQLGNNRVLFPVQITEDDEEVIEVVPIKASAGYLEGFSDPEYISNLPQLKLPFVPAGKHRAFPVKGDSMEPWVKEGAFVVGKFVEEVWELKNGQTYVFVTEREGVVYKRLSLEKIDDKILILKSDNSFYKPLEIELEDLVEAWEFTCKIDTKSYDDEELNMMSILKMLRGFEVELKDIKRKIN